MAARTIMVMLGMALAAGAMPATAHGHHGGRGFHGYHRRGMGFPTAREHCRWVTHRDKVRERVCF